jgi:hypothetical protein
LSDFQNRRAAEAANLKSADRTGDKEYPLNQTPESFNLEKIQNQIEVAIGGQESSKN